MVWLDATGAYTTFVDGLAARAKENDFPFPVVGFRGSFLELVLALEPFGSGLDNAPLLIHMPGYTEESIRKTPVLELYEPGFRFRKAPETLVREVAAGKVPPETLERFLAAGLPSLEAADEWLASQLDRSREGLARTLESLGPKAVLGHAVDALGPGDTFLAQRVATLPEREVLQAYLCRQTGDGRGMARLLRLGRRRRWPRGRTRRRRSPTCSPPGSGGSCRWSTCTTSRARRTSPSSCRFASSRRRS